MKNICMLFISAALISVSFLSATAAFQVSGTVTDKKSGQTLPGVTVYVVHSTIGTTTDKDGRYSIRVTDTKGTLRFSYMGYKTKEVKIKKKNIINVKMEAITNRANEVVVVGYGLLKRQSMIASAVDMNGVRTNIIAAPSDQQINWNTEEYDPIDENHFRSPLNHPFSTFSIDVDATSYSNVRRFINNGQMPPKGAVRIEEMINYFQYHYLQPKGEDPVAIHTEMAGCPWNPNHQLVMIGLQGKTIPTDNLPPSNLVFLIDVSGSMMMPDKLPLVKSALKLLVDQLRP